MKSVRSSGPGGQNVNKTATKVELRVEVGAIVGLTEAQRARLLSLAQGHLDESGALLLVSQRTRSREQNLEDTLEKARAMIVAAMVEPRRRIPTKPSRASKARRVDQKKRLSRKKESRRFSVE